LAAVTTDAGGARECVVDGETGFVVPCSDTGALRVAMSRMGALPAATLARMGDAARARAVARFSVETVIEQWERAYRELGERV